MKKTLLAVLASSLLIVPAAFAQTHTKSAEQEHTYSQNSVTRRDEMVNRRVESLAVIFNLTPEQQTEARTYFTKAANENENVEMNLRADHKTLSNDIKAMADQTKLSADAAAIGNDQGKILANDANAQEHFFEMLKPQEQAKYEKLAGPWVGQFWGGPGVMIPGAIYR